jgi:hydroxymethylpyrimidine pyrophosphatase-like HAD family hydrolase
VSPQLGSSGGDDRAGLVDLRLTLAELVALLDAEPTGPLDPYLVAAGAAQVLRDAAESDPASLHRAASYASARAPKPIGRLLERAGAVAARGLDAAGDATGTRHRLEDVAERVEAALTDLAVAVLADVLDVAALEAARAALRSSFVRQGPAGGTTLRLPSCFRSFDLHPNDLLTLASRARELSIGQRVVVVGVRTSGCYLAPLLAAALRRDGVDARWCSLRPGRSPSARTRALLVDEVNRGARVVVVDDPPSSGAALERTVERLCQLGAPRDVVRLAFALHDGGAVPPRLAGLAAAVLDWPDWDVHRRLGPNAVAAAWKAGGGDDALVELRAVELPPRPAPETHARAGYLATIAGPLGQRELPLVAEGAGLGLFGRHALRVAAALGEVAPRVVGLHDGVVVREWLPETARVALDTPTRMRQAVDYVVQRRDALAVPSDPAAELAGHQPAWEVAARLLAAPYREVGLGVRAVALDAAVRRVLSTAHASVVDGQTGPGAWFERDGKLCKVGVAERAFSHLDLACYDAAYDLAGLLTGSDPDLEALAVQRYEQRTEDRVSAERLLLYRLVHLWDRQRLSMLAPDLAMTGMARAWQDWVRARLLDGPLNDGTGAFCVLDVDGVLEQSRLGAPTLTPASAAGLRALRAHGFRPLLATGRSVLELRDRCARLGLLGGVAEYGGVAYAHATGVARELVDDRDLAALAELRDHLASVPGVLLAHGFSTMVRAYRLDGAGRPRGLPPELVDASRHASRGRLCTIRGLAQTDFVPFGVDKARGLDAVLALLGETGAPIALAVGDGEPDLPVLRRAALARVPRNAAALERPWLTVTKGAYQRGFLEAVDEACGHGRATCARCGPAPELDEAALLLAAVLRGLEGGRATGLAAMPAMLEHATRLARTAPPTAPARPHETARKRRSYGRRPTGDESRDVPTGRTRAAGASSTRSDRRTRRGRRRG